MLKKAILAIVFLAGCGGSGGAGDRSCPLTLDPNTGQVVAAQQISGPTETPPVFLCGDENTICVGTSCVAAVNGSGGSTGNPPINSGNTTNSNNPTSSDSNHNNTNTTKTINNPA